MSFIINFFSQQQQLFQLETMENLIDLMTQTNPLESLLFGGCTGTSKPSPIIPSESESESDYESEYEDQKSETNTGLTLEEMMNEVERANDRKSVQTMARILVKQLVIGKPDYNDVLALCEIAKMMDFEKEHLLSRWSNKIEGNENTELIIEEIIEDTPPTPSESESEYDAPTTPEPPVSKKPVETRKRKAQKQWTVSQFKKAKDSVLANKGEFMTDEVCIKIIDVINDIKMALTKTPGHNNQFILSSKYDDTTWKLYVSNCFKYLEKHGRRTRQKEERPDLLRQLLIEHEILVEGSSKGSKKAKDHDMILYLPDNIWGAFFPLA
jgi:hypothetical protein